MQMNKKHLLIMLACCLIPLAGLVAITVFRIPTSSVIYFGLILLCPALHLLMMRGMTHPQGPEHSEGMSHDHSGQQAVGQPGQHRQAECHTEQASTPVDRPATIEGELVRR